MRPRLVDTHAHLAAVYFSAEEAHEVLARAEAAGVGLVLDAGTTVADSREAVLLAERDPRVVAAVGVHPHDASTLDQAALAEIRALAASPRVVAIGECGLDYHYDHSPRDVQSLALRLQIRLARDLGKPLVLHSRESDEDLLRILDEEWAGEVGGVVHSFASSAAVALEVVARGFHLGFGGMITFKTAGAVRSALSATPLDRMLLETDSPYLTPVPHRGKRNEPAYVGIVAEHAARELGMSLEHLAERTTANALSLFRIQATEAKD